ncbi:DUF4253 domain-containing protein [Actinacidiphila rubida]|uniref:DUF4253 domain-containing protein n=1 Tax=Actinacidiphila rubida TaxID=310780 RepID=A0A1H8DSI9_9ACTN|nr:DUF4253 domain-containing protein [Actinacidiphila rubida]SEN10219.1 protein of unknown function [Actinacidiphila rubida]
MDASTADRILGQSWEDYAREAIAEAGAEFPGRGRVVEAFGEPDSFEEVVAPFGARWPGLAAAPSPLPADADHVAARVLAALHEAADGDGDGGDDADGEDGDADGGDDDDAESCLLDRPYRSTDLPALAEERDLAGSWPYDMAELCTVLRSWEERFGTRLVGLGDDRLILSVAAPAGTPADAEAVAAEHFAFAPDTITQGFDETLRAHAAHQILNHPIWSFWWD